MKSKSEPDPVLRELAGQPCGDLGGLAKKALRKGERKLRIPVVKGNVRLVLKKGGRKRARGYFLRGYFLPGEILLFTNRRTPRRLTLVHEMRHAQQLAILGKRRFYQILGAATTPITNPLEIDAVAAEIVAGGNHFLHEAAKAKPVPGQDRKYQASLMEIVRKLEDICRCHARNIA
jgi:hypothetical protein